MEWMPLRTTFFDRWIPALLSHCINQAVTNLAKIITMECRGQKNWWGQYARYVCVYMCVNTIYTNIQTEGSIKIKIMEIGCQDVNCSDPAQDKVQYQTFMVIVMNL
jgi:hypothetical protein